MNSRLARRTKALAASLALTMAATFVPVAYGDDFDEADGATLAAQQVAASIEIDEALNELSDAITIDEDGIEYAEDVLEEAVAEINVDVINGFYETVGITPVTSDDLVEMFEAGIASVNEEILAGELEVLPNETIVDASDDTYYLQGGSTYDQTFWWGKRRYKSTYAANRWAYDLNRLAAANAGMAAIMAVALGGVGALPNGLTAAYGTALASSMQYHNNRTRRGIVADLTWALVYRVRPQ